VDKRQHPQVCCGCQHECLEQTHSAEGNKLTLLSVTRRRAKAATPSTARMMSEEFATQSPTEGTKKLTAPETVVMNASAAVLLLNILFIFLF